MSRAHHHRRSFLTSLLFFTQRENREDFIAKLEKDFANLPHEDESDINSHESGAGLQVLPRDGVKLDAATYETTINPDSCIIAHRGTPEA